METVFRTSDGFVTPWVNWDAAFPVGKVRDTEGVNDCVVRMSSDGEWKDADCSLEKMFYCEGKENLQIRRFLRLLEATYELAIFQITA